MYNIKFKALSKRGIFTLLALFNGDYLICSGNHNKRCRYR